MKKKNTYSYKKNVTKLNIFVQWNTFYKQKEMISNQWADVN